MPFPERHSRLTKRYSDLAARDGMDLFASQVPQIAWPPSETNPGILPNTSLLVHVRTLVSDMHVLAQSFRDFSSESPKSGCYGIGSAVSSAKC